MESNALEKSNKSVASRFFGWTPSMIWWIVRIWHCGLISPKTILVFPKNFLYFRFDKIEKQSIINLTSYKSKNYISVVFLMILRSPFLGKDAGFCPSPLHFVYTWYCKIEEVIKFPCLLYFWGYFIQSCCFSAFNFLSVGCLPMVRETWVQSQVMSYQKFFKWYLIPLCLTLSNIRYVSRVKWSNPGKGVALPLHLGVVAIEKGPFWLPST